MNGSPCLSRERVIDGAGVPGYLWTLACAWLEAAEIDVDQHLVRLEYRDEGDAWCQRSAPLSQDEIAMLNDGGSLLLRDQSPRDPRVLRL